MLYGLIIAIGLIICIGLVFWLIADLGGPCEQIENKELYRRG